MKKTRKALGGVDVEVKEDSDRLNIYLRSLKDESERRKRADDHIHERLDDVSGDVKRLDSKFDELREDVRAESKATRGTVGKAKIWLGIIVSVAASGGPDVWQTIKHYFLGH